MKPREEGLTPNNVKPNETRTPPPLDLLLVLLLTRDSDPLQAFRELIGKRKESNKRAVG
jgi:hypothetical protein